jgi:hypothetical protein
MGNCMVSLVSILAPRADCDIEVKAITYLPLNRWAIWCDSGEAVLTKHGVFWISGTLQFSGSPRNGGGHFQAEEAERIHTDATE